VLTLRLLIGATLLGGCDLVFSVDEVAEPTGHSVQVAGSLHRRLIENDASDVPKLSALLPPTMVSADVAFADGTKQDLTFGPDGEFAFSWPDDSEPYSLTLRSPLSDVITYQLSAASPRLVERVGGRDNRAPVSATTKLHITFPNDPAPGTSTYLELESTGIFTRRFVGNTTATVPFDWSTQGALSGPIGLLEAGPDEMIFLELQGSTTTFLQLARYGIQHQPVLVDGVDNAMPFDLVASVPDKCVSVTVDHMAEAQRLLALDPTGVNVGWYVFVAPAEEYLPELGFPLTVRNLGPSASPFSESFMFENPLEGFATYAGFEVATFGAAPVRSFVTVPIDGTCTNPVPLPTAVVKIASQLTVAGTELRAAGQVVSIDRSKLVPVTFTPTETGEAHFYIVTLRDQTPTGLVRTRIVTTEPRALIDPDVLLPARTYVVTVNTRVGHPNAATGDFETSAGIHGSGIATSTTFQVQ
jgi:hypothetical protein